MKRQNWLLLAAIVLLTALPLWLVQKPAAGPDGKVAEIFSGSDGQGQQAISELAPNYQPWFASFLTPASKEIESLLFALQAALGAGVIGYWLGAAVTRDKMRRPALLGGTRSPTNLPVAGEGAGLPSGGDVAGVTQREPHAD